MKKVLLVTVLFLSVAIVYFAGTLVEKEPLYLSPNDEIASQDKPPKSHEIYGVIQEINQKNAGITSLFSKNVPVKLQQNKLTVRVYGQLAFEKEKKLRLIIWHKLTGKEMDIGSNDEYIWFWSKRMNPPALHYAKRDCLNKTMLRTALNPDWIIESLNVDSISDKDIEICKFKDYWIVSQNRIGISGEFVQCKILIDPSKKVVLGRYLYDLYDNMIASAEYEDFQSSLPRKLKIVWHEENIILNWDLSKIEVNTNINSNFWTIPSYNSKIDIGK